MWRRWSNKCNILQHQKMLQLQNNWPFSNLIQHLATSCNILQHVSIFASIFVFSIAVHNYDFHIFTAIIQPYRVNKWLIDYFFRCTVYYACLHWYLLLNHKEIVVLLPFQMTSFGSLKLRASRSFCFPPLHGLMWKDLKNGHFPEEEC